MEATCCSETSVEFQQQQQQHGAIFQKIVLCINVVSVYQRNQKVVFIEITTRDN
jgi:hypothetical protein